MEVRGGRQYGAGLSPKRSPEDSEDRNRRIGGTSASAVAGGMRAAEVHGCPITHAHSQTHCGADPSAGRMVVAYPSWPVCPRASKGAKSCAAETDS